MVSNGLDTNGIIAQKIQDSNSRLKLKAQDSGAALKLAALRALTTFSSLSEMQRFHTLDNFVSRAVAQ